MKKRILQVVGNLDTGGLQTVAMNCVRYTDRSKFDYDFLVYGKSIGRYESEAVDLRCRVIHVEKPKNHYAFYKCIRLIIQNNGPYDVVYSHTLFNSGIVLKAAKSCGVRRCVAHAHTIERPSGKKLTRRCFYKMMRRWLRKYSDERLACSEDAGKYVFGANFPFTLVNNGIDVEKYIYSQSERIRIRNEFGITDEFVLGNVGRFGEAKNQIFAIDVFYRLHRRIPNSILLLVGDGELKLKAESYAEKLGIEKFVIFAGDRSDVPGFLSAMDVFIFPSIYEGLGIVGIEAQAAGLVTICSDCVPKEVKVTELLKFKALSDGADAWAEIISEYAKGYPREDMSRDIKNKGFDVKQTTNIMEQIFEE